jgi:long-chain fatty acid transport protein
MQEWKMKKYLSLLSLVLFILTGTQHLKATGLSAFEIGARAAALAGAFVAHVDDASTVYYNPAGMVFLKGIRAKTNLLYSSRNTKATLPESAPMPATGPNIESDLLFIRGAHFLTWNLFDRLSLGIGIFNPYIAQTKWIVQNPYSYETKFNVYFIRPALAFKPFKGFSIGMGVDIVISTLLWTHAYTWYQGIYGPYLAYSRYDGNGSGLGFSAGFLWKIGSKFQIGGRYQHRVNVKMSGKQIFQAVYNYPVSSVNSNITLPSEFELGLKLNPVNRLAFCFDVQWSQWHVTKGWELEYDRAKDNRDPDFYQIWGDFLDRTIKKGNENAKLNLKDTITYKFGLEYQLSKRFSLRAGFSNQPSAVKDGAIHPLDPDLDRNIISLGLGHEGSLFSIWDPDESSSILSFDLFFQYVMTKKQTSTIPDLSVTFDNDHFIIGCGLGFTF